jgi:hypothetical protein
MAGEIDIYGLFVPSLFAFMAVAFLLQAAVSRILLRAGLHRRIWHPPLFNASLFVIFLGGIVFAAQWVSS